MELVYGDVNVLTELIDIILAHPFKNIRLLQKQQQLYPGFKEKGEFAKRVVEAMNAIVSSNK